MMLVALLVLAGVGYVIGGSVTAGFVLHRCNRPYNADAIFGSTASGILWPVAALVLLASGGAVRIARRLDESDQRKRLPPARTVDK